MSPDDLIAAFAELAAIDPSMRIDRTKVGELDEIRLAGWGSVQTKHKFEAIASDAVALYAPTGNGDEQSRWLWIVRKQAPELVEPDRNCLGYAEVDGERVEMVAETIPHAAGAAVLVVRRLKDAQRRRGQLTPPPIGVVDAAAVAAAQQRCPTLESALIHLSRQSEGEPFNFAITWVHSRCTWSSRRNGAELWDYIGQLSRGDIVDGEVREIVVPRLREVDTPEHRRAFWSELLSRFQQVELATANAVQNDAQVESDDSLDDLVTLDQAAAVVGQSKRTLERYLQREDLPRPDLPGGGGRAHRWRWSTLRPSLEEHFRPGLPTKFPASRVV